MLRDTLQCLEYERLECKKDTKYPDYFCLKCPYPNSYKCWR